MDEVRTWAKDLKFFIAIKGQRYHTLMDVYIVEDLDKLKDWIKKVDIGNKVMEGLHKDI